MLIDENVKKDPSSSLSHHRVYAPHKMLAFLAIQIFLAEIIAMIFLYFIKVPNYIINTLLDGTLMLLLIVPGLYFLQLKPLLTKIKEHEQAEQALRTSEVYKNKVMEAMPVGVWLVDRNGKILLGNPASQEIWAGVRYVGKNGYSEYKATWTATGETVKPDEWAATRAITEGKTLIMEEINIEAFDGSKKTILNSAAPILDEKNTILGAVVINQDITQSKQMEIKITRSNALLERFFNSIHTLIAYLDRDFVFLRVNQAYADAAGHSVDYFNGKNHFDLYPHEENEAIFRQVVDTGQPFSITEKPFEYPDFPERGITYWDWSLQPVMGDDGQVQGLVFSLLDVTRRKQAEVQLERQNQDLRVLTQTERKMRGLAEGLVQSVIALNTSLNLDEVLSSVLQQIHRAIPFQGADIILKEGNSWRVAAFLGFESFPAFRPDLEKSYTFEFYPLLQQIPLSHEMLILDSVNQNPAWWSNTDLAWVQSYAGVPLMLDQNVTGMIELYSELPSAFEQDTADRLRAFAAPAALALQNARIYQAEFEARRVAETLSSVNQALSQTLDLEQVISTLVDHVQEIVNCDTSEVILMEGEDCWARRASRGYNAWADRDDIPNFPLDQPHIIERITATPKCLILANSDLSAGQAASSGTLSVQHWAVLPIVARDKMIGFVALGKAGKEAFHQKQLQWAETLVMGASIAIQNAWLFKQVRSDSIRLQSLARNLVELQENERYHIARELHDEAGQALTSLKLSLSRLEQDPDCPPSISQRLIDLNGVADGVLEDLHRLAMDLRPVALDHLGLVAALEQLANHLRSDKLSVKFKSIGIEGERLPQDLETSLYRIVQEALTNVLHHAHATSIGILLERSGGTLKLFIEDDGIGFIPEQAENGGQLGLVGMRERAEMFGGSLSIESYPGSGTSIIVEVPDVDTYSHHR